MSEVNNKPRVVSENVKRDQSDPTRVAITFVVHANDPSDARDFAASDQLIQHGIRVCEKLPLLQVGISSRGMPCFCDKEGNLLDVGFISPDCERPTDYYYTVTYEYIGAS